ncbi:MAG: hypothetical protein HY016_07890 [Nitrosomonadales bacterium]|nr:hypothetical protein [Nitrosomonadales bacterium]
MHFALNFERRLIGALLLGLLVTIAETGWAEPLKVLVVLSDNTPPYQSFADVLSKNLPVPVQATVLAGQFPQDGQQADLIVAVGMKATELAAAQADIPVLAVMVPQFGFEKLLAQIPTRKKTHTFSAVYLDQPWARRIDFLRAMLPDLRKIGLLYSPEAHLDVPRLRQVIAHRGSSLVAQPVESSAELFAKLESVLTSSDALLAVPDGVIYSSSTIRNILLTSYRHRIPLIGLSQAYVNAGALGAVFSTPEQLAAQAGAVVISYERTGQLPEPQFPVNYSIALNQQVARSLEIELPSPEAIRNRMDKARESSP